MGRRTVAAALGLVLAAQLGPRAVADTSGSEDKQRKLEAADHYEKGQKQFEAGRYDAAASHFKKAWDQYPDPAYLFNIGLAYEKKGEWELAVRYYERFLDEAPDHPARPEVERRLRGARKGLESSLAEVQVRSEPSGLKAELTSSPEGPSCETPCTLRAPSGPVTVAVGEGEGRVTKTRSLSPGQRWKVRLTPSEGAGETMAITEGTTMDAGKRRRIGAITSWGAGGAALVAGAVLAGVAKSDYDAAPGAASRDRFETLRDRVDRRSVGADVSFGLAAAGLVTGTVLWLVRDGGEGDGGEPRVGAGPNGVRGTVWRF